jgi:hypothetical protein
VTTSTLGAGACSAGDTSPHRRRVVPPRPTRSRARRRPGRRRSATPARRPCGSVEATRPESRDRRTRRTPRHPARTGGPGRARRRFAPRHQSRSESRRPSTPTPDHRNRADEQPVTTPRRTWCPGSLCCRADDKWSLPCLRQSVVDELVPAGEEVVVETLVSVQGTRDHGAGADHHQLLGGCARVAVVEES